MRKIILFELNEVPFSVIDYYVKKFPSSKLAKTLPQMWQYETTTEDKGHLSPWITWPTLHRGVTSELHEIKDFGEDFAAVDKKYPPVWKILTANGIKSGVFASMHTFPMPKNYEDYAFFVPDPFSGDSQSHPKKIEPFQEFNLIMSRKSGRNVDSGIDMKSALNMGLSLPRLGIKVSSLAKVGEQLVRERIKPHLRTRRRTFQSVLAFDIFMDLMRKTKPDFTTCFSNHVASAMHRYWAATFPNDYAENKMDADWLEKYKDEVDFAMGEFDRFLRELIRFVEARPEYQLWITSSMGQKATRAEMVKTESYCPDMKGFIKAMGLQENEWEQKQAMHPQYNLEVIPEKAADFYATLSQLHIDGKPLAFRQKETTFFSIDLGHKNLEEDVVEFKGEKILLTDIGLSNEPIDDETGSTAYHVKEGSLMIYDPQNKKPSTRKTGISTRAIVPTILDNFNINTPDYMVEQRVVLE